jgi:hypothetical protein
VEVATVEKMWRTSLVRVTLIMTSKSGLKQYFHLSAFLYGSTLDRCDGHSFGKGRAALTDEVEK